ncbi:diguanylate cyclase [Aliiglaciecola sp. M165]|nr:diguanylate cyclase [Aliiglaciecola sp. M165]
MITTHALSDSFDTFHVKTGDEALSFCANIEPDLILMDINMPGISGLETCKIIKGNESLKDIPILFITASQDAESEDQCWESGCTDFITKPFSTNTLRHRVNAHVAAKLMADRLKELASIDGLTGVHNRRYFEQYFDEQAKLSARNKKPLSILMIDIDFFKQYNDLYGHLAGDDCLRLVANIIDKALERPTDHVARYGGEEFVVILPDTDIKGLEVVAKHILQKIQTANIVHEGAPNGVLSVSLGGCSAVCDLTHYKSLILSADEKLYLAKRSGRNRYQVN